MHIMCMTITIMKLMDGGLLNKKGSGWKGESRRHSLSRKGIKTNLPDGRRFDVSNYVARGNRDSRELGDRVKVAEDNDNENYNDFRDKILIITHIAHNTEEHPGYDDILEGMALYDFETEDGEEIDSSLYEYEIEGVD